MAPTVGARRERARRTPRVEIRKPRWRGKDAQAVFRKYLAQKSEASAKKGGNGGVHDVPLYEVGPTS